MPTLSGPSCIRSQSHGAAGHCGSHATATAIWSGAEPRRGAGHNPDDVPSQFAEAASPAEAIAEGGKHWTEQTALRRHRRQSTQIAIPARSASKKPRRCPSVWPRPSRAPPEHRMAAEHRRNIEDPSREAAEPAIAMHRGSPVRHRVPGAPPFRPATGCARPPSRNRRNWPRPKPARTPPEPRRSKAPATANLK